MRRRTSCGSTRTPSPLSAIERMASLPQVVKGDMRREAAVFKKAGNFCLAALFRQQKRLFVQRFDGKGFEVLEGMIFRQNSHRRVAHEEDGSRLRLDRQCRKPQSTRPRTIHSSISV